MVSWTKDLSRVGGVGLAELAMSYSVGLDNAPIRALVSAGSYLGTQMLPLEQVIPLAENKQLTDIAFSALASTIIMPFATGTSQDFVSRLIWNLGVTASGIYATDVVFGIKKASDSQAFIRE